MAIDLADVDIAVLSHGHYDHGGGLASFLQLNKKALVYLSRHAFGSYYNGTKKYIGLDQPLKESSRLCFADDILEIEKGLALYSCNEREREVNLGSFGLTELREGEFFDDSFLHEQYLLIEEEGKRVLISGCSHKGVLNIVKWFAPDVFIGGFHFSGLPLDETLKGYAEYLNSFDTIYYTCHCTGVEQYKFMKQYMPNLGYLSTGQSIFV